MNTPIPLGLILLTCLGGPVQAQDPPFTDAFPVEEFAERRTRVLETIGDAVAVIHGATEYPGKFKFRQFNQFFYLTGVEVPRAILVMDGRSRTSTLYLQPRNERTERSEGPVLIPGETAARLTGIEAVLSRDQFGQALYSFGQGNRVFYTPFRPEAGYASTAGTASSHAAASAADPWDGRPSRQAAFIDRLRVVAPQAEIRNLDPILDAMRQIKSPREIELMRRATEIAGEAIVEGMRSVWPGAYEYELEAIGDYVFKRNNAQGFGYRALVAAGENAHYPHYHAAQSRLDDGELVLWDWAPDFKYYTSDVTRMFPASGTFTPRQRELYTIYLRMYQALLGSIRPYTTPAEIAREASGKMETIFNEFSFSEPAIRDAAERFIDGYRNREVQRLGHWVGMEVHDVGVPFEVLTPGMVFTIEPALRIPEERLYIRCEDILVITETGFENLSSFVPIEIEDIERLMAERGFAEPHGG
jgi:Xaa-Pro aminopeptidase